MSEPAALPFDDARRLAWLRLWRSENIGPKTFDTLLLRFGSAEAALAALPDLLARKRPSRPITIATEDDIRREIAVARNHGACFICRDEPGFPAMLRSIDSAPAVIAVQGRIDVLERPSVAIVGSRNASAAGLAFAERLARGLAQAGYVVVSGFARGIDSRAHRAGMATGSVAVLAGGLDKLYPTDSGPLMDRLLEDGAAVSEMPFGWEPRGRDFPRRNRIVSGLSLGVIVVEAARRSGSLITARFAADQGREVFAVPGSPLDPRCEGTNDLLRDGATLCADVEDVLRALAGRTMGQADDQLRDPATVGDDELWGELDLFDLPDPSPSAVEEEAPDLESRGADDERRLGYVALPVDGSRAVLERLGPAPVSIDELARASEVPVATVRSVLLELEVAGRIERHGGGLVSLLMAP